MSISSVGHASIDENVRSN